MSPVTPRVTPLPLLAVFAGGAVGGVLRWRAGDLVPDGTGFPQTTFAINVSGSLLLALLPALAVVRRSRALTVGLGPGLLGGWTTLSAASEQTRSLLDTGRPALAGLYLLGTLAACLVAVELGSRLSTRAQRDELETEGGDG